MGYFNHLSLYKDFHGNRPDTSFPTPIMVLQWRIIDLEERLAEVKKTDKSLEKSRIPKEILHYILPEQLFRVKDVEAAIFLAQKKIAEEELEETKAYKEVYPEPRLSLPSVVIISSEKAVENYRSREKVRANGA